MGATDELGEKAVEVVHPIRDLHVTLLRLLGLDDNKLTYFHGGRVDLPKEKTEIGEVDPLTYLAVAPYRNPLMLAKTAATLDVVSGGRLTLGLGTGYLKGEFRALGADFDNRNAGFDELLDVLPLHWSGEPFSYEGTGFSARDVIGLPSPIQEPIPVWIGGNAAVTRRRVAHRAQGWMPLVAPPEVVAVTRTPAVTGIDDVAARVAEIRDLRGNDDFDVLYPYKEPDLAAGVPTDMERHVDALGRLADAGVTAVALTGPGDGPLTRTTEWINAVGSAFG